MELRVVLLVAPGHPARQGWDPVQPPSPPFMEMASRGRWGAPPAGKRSAGDLARRCYNIDLAPPAAPGPRQEQFLA